MRGASAFRRKSEELLLEIINALCYGTGSRGKFKFWMNVFRHLKSGVVMRLYWTVSNIMFTSTIEFTKCFLIFCGGEFLRKIK